MRTLLVVPHPRRIPECVEAFAALRADVVYLSGYTAVEVCPVMAEVVEAAGYDAYLVCADDCIVGQAALCAVVDLLEQGHPAATGWCCLDRAHPLVNLTRGPLRGDVPVGSAYDFRPRSEVVLWPEPAVPTGFMGMALTGMSREMWRRFPMGCFSRGLDGWSSDFHLSARLRDAGIPMVAARDGEVEHVKEAWQRRDRDPAKRLLVGEIPKEAIFQCVSSAA